MVIVAVYSSESSNGKEGMKVAIAEPASLTTEPGMVKGPASVSSTRVNVAVVRVVGSSAWLNVALIVGLTHTLMAPERGMVETISSGPASGRGQRWARRRPRPHPGSRPCSPSSRCCSTSPSVPVLPPELEPFEPREEVVVRLEDVEPELELDRVVAAELEVEPTPVDVADAMPCVLLPLEDAEALPDMVPMGPPVSDALRNPETEVVPFEEVPADAEAPITAPEDALAPLEIEEALEAATANIAVPMEDDATELEEALRLEAVELALNDDAPDAVDEAELDERDELDLEEELVEGVPAAVELEAPPSPGNWTNG